MHRQMAATATTSVAVAAWAALLLLSAAGCVGQALVPGVMIFGDSVVDAGNNNRLATLVRADFPPYGRDFPATHAPTGRFCNGKLATDYTVENLGLSSYPPAYLGEEAQTNNKSLLHGANFASGAAGYLDATAALYVQNYYVNAMLAATYTPEQFADALMTPYTAFVESLYGLGARRVGVTSLPPMGCLPASVTLFGGGNGGCVERLNNDSLTFNAKLQAASEAVKKQHPDLKLVVFDIYNPLLNLVSDPNSAGFFEARRACCGTGTIETSVLCNQGAVGTCANATGYVFWDGFHPTDAANKVLADALLLQGLQLIS